MLVILSLIFDFPVPHEEASMVISLIRNAKRSLQEALDASSLVAAC